MRKRVLIAVVVLVFAGGGGVVVFKSWDWLMLSSAAREANAMLTEAETYTRINAYPGETRPDPLPKPQHAEYLEWQQRDPEALQRAIVYRRKLGLWVMPFPSTVYLDGSLNSFFRQDKEDVKDYTDFLSAHHR